MPLENHKGFLQEPKKSDYITDTIAPNNPIKSYDDYEKIIEKTSEGGYHIYWDTISKNFTAMNHDLSQLLVSLRSGTLTKDEFINVVTTCNKIIDDAEKYHSRIIQEVLSDPALSKIFTLAFRIQVENIKNYKLSHYNIPAMKKSLSEAIDEGFRIIHDEWKIKQ